MGLAKQRDERERKLHVADGEKETRGETPSQLTFKERDEPWGKSCARPLRIQPRELLRKRQCPPAEQRSASVDGAWVLPVSPGLCSTAGHSGGTLKLSS